MGDGDGRVFWVCGFLFVFKEVGGVLIRERWKDEVVFGRMLVG